jgi:multiple sugar transport system substrate-binding protein
VGEFGIRKGEKMRAAATFARLGGLALAVGLALWPAGCAPKEKPGEAAKSITIWWAKWAPADGLQELGNEFEKETGVAVKVHQIPWSDYQTQVFLAFGNPTTDFDVVVGDSQWIGKGATEGLYLELTDWLKKSVDMSKIHARAAKYLCEYPTGSGRFYAAPCETDACGFVYQKEWFEDPAERSAFGAKYGRELAPPETWEEFREVAEFFTRPDEKRYGCAILSGRAYDSLTMGFQHFLWGFGGSWGDPETFGADGHVNGPEAVSGLEFMKELVDEYSPKGGGRFGYGEAVESVNNRSCAMAMIYFAFYPDIVARMGDEAGFFMIPSKDGRRVISLGGQGFSISTKAPPERQELAKKFIAWFLETENQRKWITKPAGFTANTDVLGSEEFRTAQPYNAAFADSLDHLQDFWNVPVYNELLGAAQKYVGEALDGVKSPKAALDALAAEHEKILRAAGFLK